MGEAAAVGAAAAAAAGVGRRRKCSGDTRKSKAQGETQKPRASTSSPASGSSNALTPYSEQEQKRLGMIEAEDKHMREQEVRKRIEKLALLQAKLERAERKGARKKDEHRCR
eukprot:6210854-Pleurochrysis_carterae.AAC.1